MDREREILYLVIDLLIGSGRIVKYSRDKYMKQRKISKQCISAFKQAQQTIYCLDVEGREKCCN